MHKISLAKQKELANHMIPVLSDYLIANSYSLSEEELLEGCTHLAMLMSIATD